MNNKKHCILSNKYIYRNICLSSSIISYSFSHNKKMLCFTKLIRWFNAGLADVDSSIRFVIGSAWVWFPYPALHKQKAPLLRGSCFNPLGGGYFNSTISTFLQRGGVRWNIIKIFIDIVFVYLIDEMLIIKYYWKILGQYSHFHPQP